MKTLKTLIAGEPIEIKQQEWTEISVAKLASLLGVAEAALDVAKEHAAQQRWQAMQSSVCSSRLLAAALAVAAGMMLIVSRRVTGSAAHDPGGHAGARARRPVGGGVVTPRARTRSARWAAPCRCSRTAWSRPSRLRDRAEGDRGAGRRAAEGRDAAARRRVRDGGRQHRRDRVVGLDRARSGGRHADQDRRDDPAAVRRGGVGLRGGLAATSSRSRRRPRR